MPLLQMLFSDIITHWNKGCSLYYFNGAKFRGKIQIPDFFVFLYYAKVTCEWLFQGMMQRINLFTNCIFITFYVVFFLPSILKLVELMQRKHYSSKEYLSIK